MPSPVCITLDGQIPADCAGLRLDQALAILWPTYSRARLQQWVKEGALRVDDQLRRPKDIVRGGEQVVGTITEVVATTAQPQDIPLDVLFADAHLIVLNKPVGCVVHPAAGHAEGTLVNALLHHFPELGGLPRAGLVHRLDKDTSGLLVVARSLEAHHGLVQQLQARSMGREYMAIVQGQPITGGTVDAPIGRHPVDRQRMAVVAHGKPAITHYRIGQRFRAHTLLQVRLETGRTHQIRVHLAHVRLHLLGDPAYGARLRLPPGAQPDCIAALQGFQRQALHAHQLHLSHPLTGEPLTFQADAPTDLVEILRCLAEDSATPSITMREPNPVGTRLPNSSGRPL